MLVELLACLDPEEQYLGALQLGAVERELLAFHIAEQILLHTVGQVLGDLAFSAAQQKGADARGEPATGERIVLAH